MTSIDRENKSIMMNFKRLKTIDPRTTTILLVDVQKSEIDAEHQKNTPWYYQRIIEECLPNMQQIIRFGRSLGMEIMYTTIESLTIDGRDRSLDHKLSDIFIPKNSPDGQVIDAVAPHSDDIWLRKTSSGVFNSTNIDYLLRNLGIVYLVIMGMLTDQCVDMAVRDAADKGYQVICISDACATHSLQRHENALNAFKGYCTLMTTNQFIQFVQQSSKSIKPMSLTTLVTTDLIGITRGRSVFTDQLDDYWLTGCGWVPANSALTSFDIIADPNPWGSIGDLRLLPDRNSRITLINGPQKDAPIFDYVHCDIVETDGQSWSCCPRTLLKEEIERYRTDLKMKILVAFEHEFTLREEKSSSLSTAFSLRAQRNQSDFASWLMSALRAAHIEPEMFLPEYGQNQYEVTCHPTDPLAAADRAVNIREITREIARQLNLNVSFSPVTSVDQTANGVHLHLSLKDLDEKSLLYDADRPNHLSVIGEHWSAGVIKHLPSLCAFTAPTPVSYLRLKPHHWSSAYACVGYRNREAAIRICPTVTFGKRSIDDQYNLEFRPMDSTASPHLALTMILIAGRLGIEEKQTLKSFTNVDPHQFDDDERQRKEIVRLPENLSDALEHLRHDEKLIERLPKPLIETYFAVKHQELVLTKDMNPTVLCDHYSKIY